MVPSELVGKCDNSYYLKENNWYNLYIYIYSKRAESRHSDSLVQDLIDIILALLDLVL